MIRVPERWVDAVRVIQRTLKDFDTRLNSVTGGSGISQDAADARYAGISHNHTGVYQAAGSYAASGHGHAISDVTGLQTALDGKQASGSYATSTHNHDASYAAASHSHAASDIASGTITSSQLGSGTANNTTFLRGDGIWATPAGASVVGYSLTVSAANAATTTDAQVLYFGGTFAVAPSTTAGNHRVYIPKAGTIKAAYLWAHSATAGTGESWTLAIRLNNPTDTTVQALASTAAYRVWSNTGLSISVAAGDYIEVKSTNPTWATNPANVRFGGEIYIE